MKILHLSDTHGTFPELKGAFDVIVHSGDLMPNKTRGTATEPGFQKDWVARKAIRLANWIGKTPFLYCPGNHDYYDPESVLRQHGVAATTLGAEPLELLGYKFVGFPYVPWFNGEWNYEKLAPDMFSLMGGVIDRMEAGEIDVLVAHCPPEGILDETFGNVRIGNPQLTRAFNVANKLPKAILCGHCHESPGTAIVRDCIISNAATTMRIIDLGGAS